MYVYLLILEGLRMREHESQGQSFMHPINTPCRYLYVSSSTSAGNARKVLHFLKNFCWIESVGFLGSESCHDPRSHVGKNSSTLAESKGKANLSLCQRVTGKGWGNRAARLQQMHSFPSEPKGKKVMQGAGNHHQWWYARGCISLDFCIACSH